MNIHSHLDTGAAVLGHTHAPIPWMLTKEEIAVVDDRFRNVVIPHGVHAFCTFKEGLLENRSACWRMISKFQVFFMIPVMFRGTVPGLLSGLAKVVYSIMLMCGRVISERKRRQSRCVCVYLLSFLL